MWDQERAMESLITEYREADREREYARTEGHHDQGTVLEVLLDSGEPYDNVMESLSVEGIEVVETLEKDSGVKRIKVTAK